MNYQAYPKYKDSGVDWLGDIPTHWKSVAIKRKFNIINGSTPKSGEPLYWDGNITWVTPADFSNNNNGYIEHPNRKITKEGLNSCGTTLVPANSVVITTRAPIGAVAQARAELCTNQGCKSLVLDAEDIHERFIYYTLAVSSNQLNALGLGTTFMELSKDALGYYQIPLPSKDEQIKIVKFLDYKTQQIDQLIEKKNLLIEKINEQRTSIIYQVIAGKIDIRKVELDYGEM